MAIKQELRETHQFSKEEVSISAELLVVEHTSHQRNNPFNFSREIRFSLGLLMIGGGFTLIIFLWQSGFIAVLPFVIISGGFGLLFQSLKQP